MVGPEVASVVVCAVVGPVVAAVVCAVVGPMVSSVAVIASVVRTVVGLVVVSDKTSVVGRVVEEVVGIAVVTSSVKKIIDVKCIKQRSLSVQIIMYIKILIVSFMLADLVPDKCHQPAMSPQGSHICSDQRGSHRSLRSGTHQYQPEQPEHTH